MDVHDYYWLGETEKLLYLAHVKRVNAKSKMVARKGAEPQLMWAGYLKGVMIAHEGKEYFDTKEEALEAARKERKKIQQKVRAKGLF